MNNQKFTAKNTDGQAQHSKPKCRFGKLQQNPMHSSVAPSSTATAKSPRARSKTRRNNNSNTLPLSGTIKAAPWTKTNRLHENRRSSIRKRSLNLADRTGPIKAPTAAASNHHVQHQQQQQNALKCNCTRSRNLRRTQTRMHSLTGLTAEATRESVVLVRRFYRLLPQLIATPGVNAVLYIVLRIKRKWF